jgi:hypothetical protein
MQQKHVTREVVRDVGEMLLAPSRPAAASRALQ